MKGTVVKCCFISTWKLLELKVHTCWRLVLEESKAVWGGGAWVINWLFSYFLVIMNNNQRSFVIYTFTDQQWAPQFGCLHITSSVLRCFTDEHVCPLVIQLPVLCFCLFRARHVSLLNSATVVSSLPCVSLTHWLELRCIWQSTNSTGWVAFCVVI